MKKYIYAFALLAIFILQSGCTKILLYSFGVRNPKIENQKSLNQYLKRNKITTENSFCLKDTISFNKFYTEGIGIPEIRFYDSNGYLMLYRDEKKCNAQNDSLISFLNPSNVSKIDSSNNIKDYLKNIKMLNGKDIEQKHFENFDYYLIIYWAKWAGKVNKKKMVDWENSIKQKSGLKIMAIKVTTDYMNFWVLDKKDMIKIYSRKSKTENK
jgi:hypothetical protein